MTPLPLRRPQRLVAGAVITLGVLTALAGLLTAGSSLPTLLQTHARTLVVFVGLIAAGELLRIRMPSGRATAPLAAASAMAMVFLGPVDGQPTLEVRPGLVVLVVAAGLALAGAVRRVRHRPVAVAALAARLVGVSVAASAARGWGVDGQTLWDDQMDPTVSRGVVAVGMALVAAIGLLIELVLVAAARAERQHGPWSVAVRDVIGEAAPLTLAVLVTGPMVALMAPVLGLLALPTALVPLAMAYAAVRQYARNRATNRQLILTLSHITERGGYTATGHAERVCDLSVRIGRLLGLGDRHLRDLEYAALLHDLGQIALRDPIPGGATVLAAPADQRDIAAEGARIIRRAGSLDVVAGYVEGQTTPYRQVRELSEEVPLASRIIKCANAFDDLTGGSQDPSVRTSALERINLGLGYEYDPDVVDTLARVVANGMAGRIEDRRVLAR